MAERKGAKNNNKRETMVDRTLHKNKDWAPEVQRRTDSTMANKEQK